MSSTAAADGQAFDAQPDTSDNNPGAYDPKLHEQLKALADHAELSVELAERQIEELQEALEGRRTHAREQAEELRAYEDRHDVHETNRSTTPQE